MIETIKRTVLVADETFTIHGIDFDKVETGQYLKIKQGGHIKSVPEQRLSSTTVYVEWRRRLAKNLQKMENQRARENPSIIE